MKRNFRGAKGDDGPNRRLSPLPRKDGLYVR